MNENKINWVIIEPLSKAYIFDDDDDAHLKVPKSILDIKKPIKTGDSVALIYRNSEPVLTEPVKGTTLKNLLMAIERGMKRIIPNTYDNTKTVYAIIGSFFHAKDRIMLTKKFESGKLTAADLVGDHVFFEGNFKRKNKIWLYATGS